MHRRKPLFQGWLRSTFDALLVFEAARQGLIPRVTRRFHDIEKRNIIQSGSIFVFTEEESGIRRWTDPFLWSASRMLGNFLIYREKEDSEVSGALPYKCLPLMAKDDASALDPQLEKDIYGSWNKGKGLKADGMMKKTMSMTIEGVTYHLVAYYRPSDVRSGMLQPPSDVHEFSSLRIDPKLLSDLSQFRHPPIFEVEVDGSLHHVADREEKLSVADLSSANLYRMSPTPRPSPSPKLYTSLSEVPYCINRDRYMPTPTPSPTFSDGDLPRTPELTLSPIFSQNQHFPVNQLGSDAGTFSASHCEEHWNQSLSFDHHYYQTQPANPCQSTSEYQMQALLDPFRLAYNSPVFWDISWGGPDHGVQSWEQVPFCPSQLLEETANM